MLHIQTTLTRSTSVSWPVIKIYVSKRGYIKRSTHNPKKEPWLYLVDIIPKTIQDYQKEKHDALRGEPPGSTFQSVQVRPEDIEQAQAERFSQALIDFRQVFEKPVIDAYKEVDAELEVERKKERGTARFNYRQARREKGAEARKPDALTRMETEKTHWQNMQDTTRFAHFKDWPRMSQVIDVLNMKKFKQTMTEVNFDYSVLKDDYGNHKQWTIEQHFASMVPVEEVDAGHLDMTDLIKREHLDFLYRVCEEMEYIYKPYEEKIEQQQRYELEYGRQNRRTDKLPDFWENLNPDLITEFDNIENDDTVTLEELKYRFDVAFKNFQQRLLDPAVDDQLNKFMKSINFASDTMPYPSVHVSMMNMEPDFEKTHGFQLTPADQIRVLKPQLLEAGLARQQIKYDESLATPLHLRTPDQSMIMDGDEKAYFKFMPMYEDHGTAIAKPKPKAPKEAPKKEELEEVEQFIEEIQKEEKGQKRKVLSKKRRYKLLYAAKEERENEMDPDQMKVVQERAEEALHAHSAYVSWRRIWPIVGSDHSGEIEGARLDNFLKLNKWYPRNHLVANNPIEFFIRKEPFAFQPDYLHTMKYRKVVMKVYMRHFELPRVVELRLKELTGPRYDWTQKILTLTGNERQTQAENKAYLKLLFREILHEAWLADPNYLPIREESVEEEQPWKPSDEAQKVNKPILFRLFGFTEPASLADTEAKAKELRESIMSQFLSEETSQTVRQDKEEDKDEDEDEDAIELSPEEEQAIQQQTRAFLSKVTGREIGPEQEFDEYEEFVQEKLGRVLRKLSNASKKVDPKILERQQSVEKVLRAESERKVASGKKSERGELSEEELRSGLASLGFQVATHGESEYKITQDDGTENILTGEEYRRFKAALRENDADEDGDTKEDGVKDGKERQPDQKTNGPSKKASITRKG